MCKKFLIIRGKVCRSGDFFVPLQKEETPKLEKSRLTLTPPHNPDKQRAEA